MASPNEDDNLGAVALTVILAVGLSLVLAVGIGIWKLKRSATPTQTTAVSGVTAPAGSVRPGTPVTASVPAPGLTNGTSSTVLGVPGMGGTAMVATPSGSVAAGAAPSNATATATADAGSDIARVVVQGDVVKFYFTSGKAELAAGSDVVLGRVVNAVKAGKSAVVSGFHDATGSAAQNAELAKRRAFAVRDRLQALGVDAAKIELRKPEQVPGAGSDPEARRVEVSLR